MEDRGAGDTGGSGARGERLSASIALHALVEAIERRLQHRGVGRLPDAYLLGQQQSVVIQALQRGLLDYVAVIDWATFRRLSPLLLHKRFDALHAVVALSLAPALCSGVTTEVVESLDHGGWPRPQSVLFGRVTRATAGHVLFPSQLLVLAEGECDTTPLEMTSWLKRHTFAAIRAMLHGRLIKGRPDLSSEERQCLIAHITRHLSRLLSEMETYQHTLRLLRLADYRLRHPIVARQVLRRVRVVDFGSRRARAQERARR